MGREMAGSEYRNVEKFAGTPSAGKEICILF